LEAIFKNSAHISDVGGVSKQQLVVLRMQPLQPPCFLLPCKAKYIADIKSGFDATIIELNVDRVLSSSSTPIFINNSRVVAVVFF
jgi:hypothetical protein